MTVPQREALGRNAKAFLNQGRVLALQQAGASVELVSYVPTSVSPENTCLIATWPEN